MKDEVKAPTRKPTTYQPTKVELEADLTIPTTPEQLLRAVIKYNPNKPSK